MSALESLRVGEVPTYLVGTNVHYASYVEFGTSRMRAQPYLRPAAEKGATNARPIFERAPTFAAAIRLLALKIERYAKRRCPVDTGNLRGSIAAEKA